MTMNALDFMTTAYTLLAFGGLILMLLTVIILITLYRR